MRKGLTFANVAKEFRFQRHHLCRCRLKLTMTQYRLCQRHPLTLRIGTQIKLEEVVKKMNQIYLVLRCLQRKRMERLKIIKKMSFFLFLFSHHPLFVHRLCVYMFLMNHICLFACRPCFIKIKYCLSFVDNALMLIINSCPVYKNGYSIHQYDLLYHIFTLCILIPFLYYLSSLIRETFTQHDVYTGER